MTTALQTLTNKLAERFEMGDGSGLVDTLKSSAFAGATVSDAQMVALLVIANQYQLNPWTKEIYAFPGGNGGLTPIVGVDGWVRIINREPQYDGMEFHFTDDYSACTCTIYRKDRSKPIVVTEFMGECKKNSPAWNSHPKRMLRHKAMIQCARLAFGFTGIYDQDEAERIVENEKQPINVTPKNTIDTTAVELATDEQIQRITELAEITNTPIEKILAITGKQSLNEIPKSGVEKVLNKLNVTLNAQEAEREKAQQNDNLGQEIQL